MNFSFIHFTDCKKCKYSGGKCVSKSSYTCECKKGYGLWGNKCKETIFRFSQHAKALLNNFQKVLGNKILFLHYKFQVDSFVFINRHWLLQRNMPQKWKVCECLRQVQVQVQRWIPQIWKEMYVKVIRIVKCKLYLKIIHFNQTDCRKNTSLRLDVFDAPDIKTSI